MSDARLDRWQHLALVIALCGLLAVATRPAPEGQEMEAGRPLVAAAQLVGWPRSSGLLVAEVVTGADSASDEFVEIYNAASADLDLAGTELVYVTASGSTVTRKQTWTGLPIPAHRHLLLANSAGRWAAGADGLYSGGFAAAGGSLVLRTLGGTVIDSLSWGDASSAFVEGSPGPAPAAGSSLERLPGGAAGNGVDTNDNAADTHLESGPQAQSLSAGPVPVSTPGPAASATPPGATPSPNGTPAATAAATPTPSPPCTPELPTPTPTQTSAPTQTPTPAPTPTPTASPAPTVEMTPTPMATPAPTPTETPTPTATATATAIPTPTPTPTLTPTPLSISQARLLPAGTGVTVHGLLTTPLGLTEDGRGAFVEDATGGLALYLPMGDWPPAPTGSDVVVRGALESRFGQLTLSLAASGDMTTGPVGPLPDPLATATFLACEPFEARLIVAEGWIVAGGASTEEGVIATIDDGSGPLAVLAPPGAGVAASELGLGSLLRLVGVLGQRDLVGDGTSGYRLLLRSIDDVVPLAPPPTPTPTPPPSPSPTPTPTAAPSESPISIAAARLQPIGATVHVRGVVTVAPGALLGDATIAIQDASGGIFVRLPEPALSGVLPGRTLEAEGMLAAPYGNLELRPLAGRVLVLETVSQPAPRNLLVAELAENTEGLLARVTVTIEQIEAGSSGSLTLMVSDASGEGRVFFHGPLGVTRADFSVGQRLAVVGLVGDRLGLYRLWPRNESDVALIADDPSPTPAPTRSPAASDASAPVISIADALRRVGQSVTIEGVVTAQPGLFDADAQRVTLQDATAALLVRLPADVRPRIGQRLRVSGAVGTYYGAPSLAAAAALVSGQGTASPTSVRSAPLGTGLEWRLVTVSGLVESVHRDGDAWRAELRLSTGSVPISGLARSGISASALVAGRWATVTGIVKRPYPTATDQRFAVVPRSPADIRLGAAASGDPPQAPDPAGSPGPGSSPRASAWPGEGQSAPSGVGMVALGDLAAHEAEAVSVGGRVLAVAGVRLTIDDGSGNAVVRLTGEAASLFVLFAVGDLLNATGRVERNATGGLEVVVDSPESIVRLAQLQIPAAAAASASADAQIATGSPGKDALAPVPPSSATSAALVLLVLTGTLAAAALVLNRRRAGLPDLIERLAKRVPRRLQQVLPTRRRS